MHPRGVCLPGRRATLRVALLMIYGALDDQVM